MSANERPLVVGVNLAWLRPGQVGGTETYARRWLDAVSHHTGHRIIAYGSEPALAAVCPPAVVRRPLPIPAVPAARVGAERSILRRAMHSDRCDILQHLGGTLPFVSETPTAVTIHDLQPLESPQNFGGVKQQWLARQLPVAMRDASAICTPSEWVAGRVGAHGGRDHVAHVPAYATPRVVDVTAPMPTGPYVLYPAMTMRHKNHDTLFRALAIARQSRQDLRLVCTGARGRHDEEIRRSAAAVEGVDMLGLVAPSRYDELLSGAEQVLFPSRYEGFGLPILEAQMAGVPVVVSSSTALPEVAGPRTRILDPGNVHGWAKAMIDVPKGEERRRLIEAGFANAARYGAERTAQRQDEVWARIVARPPGD